MAINYEQLMAMKRLDQKYSYSDRDVLLYALGIGMGADPLDEKELVFVNEATVTARPLEVVPTFASVAAGFAEPGEFNLNPIALDGERDITFHGTLPPAAHITADSFVIAVYDKGKSQRSSHPLPNGTEEEPWRTPGDPGDFVFCAWRWRLWRVPTVSPSHTKCRAERPTGHFPRAPIKG